MSDRFGLQGKTAIVTGGGRGIGLACSQSLAKRGAKVVVVDLDQTASDDAAAQLGSGSDHFGMAADVTDRGAMQRVVAETTSRFGGVDVVIANAGIVSRGATLRAMPGEVADRILDVNINGVYNTVQAALPQIAARRGHIVTTASVYAFVNGMGSAPYAMSKAAVEQLGRALRVELAPHGASATVAYFGFIDTDMVQQALDADPDLKKLEEILPKPLLKRLQPAQAGEAVVRGIENRKARVIVPRRWAAFSTMRGIVNPLLDAYMLKDADTQDVVRTLDARDDEDLPTTA